MNLNIRAVADGDCEWIRQKSIREWGGEFIMTRMRKVYLHKIDGFIAENDAGEKVGLVTFEITGDQCEIVSLDAFEKWHGIGTALLERAVEAARAAGCRRVWLLTTNDNVDAMRFYQRRGFTLSAVYLNAHEESRKVKPTIPKIGCYGIPLRDEVEFEMWV